MNKHILIQTCIKSIHNPGKHYSMYNLLFRSFKTTYSDNIEYYDIANKSGYSFLFAIGLLDNIEKNVVYE